MAHLANSVFADDNRNGYANGNFPSALN